MPLIPEVQRFAGRMVRDHSKNDVKLSALASSKGVQLQDGKGLMNDATYPELKVLSGKEFDKAYVKAMLADHKDDVSSFEKQSADAQDPDVKNFAAKTLPMLQEHLKHDSEYPVGNRRAVDTSFPTGGQPCR
jgi:putative membrane protein